MNAPTCDSCACSGIVVAGWSIIGPAVTASLREVSEGKGRFRPFLACCQVVSDGLARRRIRRNCAMLAIQSGLTNKAAEAASRTLCAGSLAVENAGMKSAASKKLISLAMLLPICPAWGGFDEGFQAFISKEYAKALAEFRPLAIKGNAQAQRFLGVMYRRGNGVPRDGKQAAGWYLKAAGQGDGLAQSALGEMYEDGEEGVQRDEAAAADWYRKAAEQGIARAQNFLGGMYFDGRGGLPKDDDRAVILFRKAAEQGNVSAQFNLGLAHDIGTGWRKDHDQAVVWYRRAAEKGLAAAQNNLGVMYREGHGVPKDDQTAVTWFRRAAEQGSANAQVSLGFAYNHGRGVQKDDQQALIWYRKAANQGDADGQLGLAVLYGDGRGTPTDDGQAYFWALLAAARGNDKARDLRAEIESKLTTEQRAEAQASARTWRPTASGFSERGVTGQGPDSSVGADPEPRSVADATGSGFRVGGDLIVTNQHVVQDCQRVAVGGAGTARVVAKDSRNDLALLSSTAHASAAAIRTGRPQIGEQVMVAGYPLRGLLSGLNVTAGNLSSLVGMAGDTRFVQISAPVQPGNSGGPLLDARGNVIGVVVSKLNAVKVAKLTGDIPQNVNFAISTNVLREFLDANGAEYKSGAAGLPIPTPEVARRAQAITVLIECWK